MKTFFFSIACVFLSLTGCLAQTRITSPVTILPTSASVGGDLRIMAPNNTDFGEIQATGNAFTFKGKANGNGNIVLAPGNVASLASVFINTPRLDQPGQIISDASGSPTSDAIHAETNGGTRYFSVQQGTGNVVGNGTSTIGLAVSGEYFASGLFGTTVEAPVLRAIDGNPSSVADYFDWTMDSTLHIFRLKNSSSTILLNVDDQHIAGSPTGFIFNGALYPNADATFDAGAASLRWRNLWLSSLAGFGATAPVCANNSGELFSSGCTTTGFFSRSAPNISPTTANDNIIAHGTGSLGAASAGAYWNNGLFGGTLESSDVRVIDGTPASVTDYFDLTMDATPHIFRLKNSSSTILLSVDDQHIAGSPTGFIFNGALYPNTDATYDAGAASLRWRNLWLSSLSGSGTRCVDATSAGLLAVLSSDCALVPGAWTSYIPSLTYSAGTISVSATDCAYQQNGKTVNARCHVTFTLSTSGSTAATISESLPTGSASNGQDFTSAMWTGTYPQFPVPTIAVFSGSNALVGSTGVTFGGPGVTYDLVLTGTYQSS